MHAARVRRARPAHHSDHENARGPLITLRILRSHTLITVINHDLLHENRGIFFYKKIYIYYYYVLDLQL